MAGKLMRYPTDMIDSSMDYFKIEILKNIKQGGGFGNISSLMVALVVQGSTNKRSIY